MQCPCNMTKREFSNDYDIIVYALTLLIRRFQNEDNIFAAQCIWWLASIIQYTDQLRFNFEYQVFPSEYVRDCAVTPFPDQLHKEMIFLEDTISELDLAEKNNAESSGGNYIEHPSRKMFLPEESGLHSSIGSTRIGRVIKLQKINQRTLAKTYPQTRHK